MTLRDVFDQDTFIIDGQQYTDDDLNNMPIDDLETLKMRIAKKLDGLSQSLKEKQLDYSNNKKGMTKEWFAKHKSAMSINKRVLTYVNSILKNKRYRHIKLGNYFMSMAKIILKPEEFESILNKAIADMDREGIHE
jgi:hypothetical protein